MIKKLPKLMISSRKIVFFAFLLLIFSLLVDPRPVNAQTYYCPNTPVGSDYMYNYSCPWDIHNPSGFECVQEPPTASTWCGWGTDRFTGAFGWLKFDLLNSCFPTEGGCVMMVEPHMGHFSSDCYTQSIPCGSTPPTPTPPTPTPPPDTTPPTCSISGLTSVNINTDATYVATGSDPEGNLIEVEIWKSPTENRSWTNIVDGCAGPVCQGMTQFSSVGTYYVVCNAYDSAGNKCGGNPWCDNFDPVVEPQIPCEGWENCGANDLLTVTATIPGPWWQVIDADVITDGDIISSIPLSCALDDCNPLFGLEGLGGFPGVPIYGGSTADFGEGGISSTDWLANTQSLFSKIYDYNFFRKMVRSDVELVEIEQAFVNGGFFTSGGTSKRGYVWYHFDGDAFPPGNLTINSSINMIGDRKVVVLVENADLHIDGRINVEKGEGFIMFIVGKNDSGDKGNIHVKDDLPGQDEIEGVFLAEGQFKTGEGNEQLYIRGMVAAYDGIVLERDLLGDNADEPAEVFEFAPDFILNFPRDLTFRRLRWKEVAP